MILTPELIEKRRAAGRKGGQARAKQFTREYQSAAGARSAQVNDMAALGHKGAMAFIAKYGYARLYNLCRDWRLAHPSRHEQDIMDILCTLGLEPGRDYDREYEVAKFLSVDFAFPASYQAIEINGRVHYDPAFDDPRRPGTRAANDADKLARLARLGWRVLVIDYRDMHRAGQWVKEFILGG